MSLAKAYLILYNNVQLLGWSFILWETAYGLVVSKDASNIYESVGYAVRLCQGAALLETVHTAVGLTKGSVPLSFLQWFGRSNVLFLILHSVPELQRHWAVPVLFIAWALADICRYPWYAAALVGTPPKLLTWLRYTAFIPLYPLGIFGGEMPIIHAGLPYLKDRGLHSLEMPNRFNFAFSYYYFALAGLYFILPVAFLQLYGYMLRQRSKRLSVRAKNA
ncbi:g2336 [Coccomyxa elongata]